MRLTLVTVFLLGILACKGEPYDAESSDKSTEVQLWPVVDSVACNDCITFTVSGQSGRLDVAVESKAGIAISIDRSNAIAIRVDRGLTGSEWKAHIYLGDEDDRRVRHLVESKPGTEYFLISHGDRALSVIASKMLRREIVAGAFESKRALEEALGIGELSERPIKVDVGSDEKASREAIQAADEAIETHKAEAPVFEAIERALREGDSDKAARLLQTLKDERKNQ
jgi:hypothetical protein